MSTVKANNVQVGQSGTATNNFTLYQPSTPDGTVRLAVGNSGATSADVLTANNSGTLILQGGSTSATGVGITFPATQSASSDANTLDDYEEGTWTPNQGAGLTVTGTFSSAGTYTKVGNLVYVRGYVQGSTTVAVTAAGVISSNLPFSNSGDSGGGNATNYQFNLTAGVASNGTTIYATSAITASLQIIFGFTYRV